MPLSRFGQNLHKVRSNSRDEHGSRMMRGSMNTSVCHPDQILPYPSAFAFSNRTALNGFAGRGESSALVLFKQTLAKSVYVFYNDRAASLFRTG